MNDRNYNRCPHLKYIKKPNTQTRDPNKTPVLPCDLHNILWNGILGIVKSNRKWIWFLQDVAWKNIFRKSFVDRVSNGKEIEEMKNIKEGETQFIAKNWYISCDYKYRFLKYAFQGKVVKKGDLEDEEEYVGSKIWEPGFQKQPHHCIEQQLSLSL